MPARSKDRPLDLSLADSDQGPVLVVRSAEQDTPRVTPSHQHARGQAFGAHRGLLTVTTDGGHWVVPATHAVWVPPRQVHGVRTHGPYAGWSAYVLEDHCAKLPPHPVTLRVSGLLREAVARAAQWDGSALDASQARIAGVVLDELGSLPPEPLGLPMPRDARLRRIAQALVDDPADTRGLEDWAALAGLAPRTATRRFVQETGFSFSAWRQRARLLKALELLAAGQAVTRVALDLGYDNVSAFIAMFRRVLGTTPGRYFDGAR